MLGLLVASSAAGSALAAAGLAALLLQTPLSIAVADARRGKHYPRTNLAWRWAAAYSLALALALALTLWLAGSAYVLLPAFLALPLVTLQLWYEAKRRAREFVPEAAGAAAMGSLAACIALAGGWSLTEALLLWVLLAARAVPSIVYVRARLRLERGLTVRTWPSWVWHAAVVTAVSLAAIKGVLPWPVTLPYLVLTARAWYGLSSWRARAKARTVGFQEIGFGLLTVALLAAALSGC